MKRTVVAVAAVCWAVYGEPAHYRLTFEMDRPDSISGRGLTAAIEGAGSKLVEGFTEGWKRKEFVFRATDPAPAVLPDAKFGTYRTSAPIPARNAKVERVFPVHARVDGIELGAGEVLLGDVYAYSFVRDPRVQGAARPLVKASGTEWNTDRWCLKGKSELMWCFSCGDRKMLSGEVYLHCRRWYGGRFGLEISRDGCAWHPLGTMVTNRFDATVPSALLPADAVWMRLKGDGVQATGALLTAMGFRAKVDGPCVYARGATRYFAEGEKGDPPVAEVPWQYREMGAVLPGASDSRLGVWTVSSGWKVPRKALPPPKATAEGLVLRTARNEAEAVQLVLAPATDVENAKVSAEGFPDALGVEVWRVGYIQIETPTDGICLRGPVADPLPPQEEDGVAVKAGENQPFWVRAKPAKGMKADVYEGRLRIDARIGGQTVKRTVPLSVEVFDFDFPDAVTVRSLFNIGLTDVNTYHNAKTREDRERLEDIYLAALDENRLSPFRWTQYTKWSVTWQGDEPVLETADFDRAMKRVKEKYHFNAFRVSGFNSPLCCNDFGLGKASASETIPAGLCGFKDGDPEYETRVARLLRKTQAHFREQGYLKEAVFYCFDEPKHDAMEIVQRGYARLRKYAPDFRSIITAPVSRSLMGGPNIWCPPLGAFESALQRERAAAGDEFWSYVCMGPKAPWATLFPDHPSVELRTWLWQNWAMGSKGVLIWTTTLWNGAGRTLPKGMMQNPYVDAMSYRWDGSTYGNGDGRLFYPPFASVGRNDSARTVPRPAKEAPCDFSKPVSSIRLEMLKDGVEDYEYLSMLKRLDPSSPLLAVPETISKKLTDFNFDPTPIEARRVEIAREIIRLTKRNN